MIHSITVQKQRILPNSITVLGVNSSDRVNDCSTSNITYRVCFVYKFPWFNKLNHTFFHDQNHTFFHDQLIEPLKQMQKCFINKADLQRELYFPSNSLTCDSWHNSCCRNKENHKNIPQTDKKYSWQICKWIDQSLNNFQKMKLFLRLSLGYVSF